MLQKNTPIVGGATPDNGLAFESTSKITPSCCVTPLACDYSSTSGEATHGIHADVLSSSTYLVTLDTVDYPSKPSGFDAGSITNRMKGSGGRYVSLSDLMRAISQGCTWCGGTFAPSIHQGWGAFLGQRLFGLDFDQGLEFISADESLERCRQLGLRVLFWYETFSSTPWEPRFRVVIDAGELVRDRATAEAFMASLLAEFNEADQSCRNCNRLFFGTNGPVHYVGSDGLCASEWLATRPAPAPSPAPMPRQTDHSDHSDHSDLAKILFTIPCGALSRLEWFKVSDGFKSAGGSFSVWDAWNRSDPERYDEAENARQWSTFNGSHGSGTVVYFAKQYSGYSR